MQTDFCSLIFLLFFLLLPLHHNIHNNHKSLPPPPLPPNLLVPLFSNPFKLSIYHTIPPTFPYPFFFLSLPPISLIHTHTHYISTSKFPPSNPFSSFNSSSSVTLQPTKVFYNPSSLNHSHLKTTRKMAFL
ncbi:hypothetical protein J3Q64DRAFT_1101443 [Phycomyces blakesleeanus]|uniref:Uncharacterized protein n=1 Tax=Phycomyces blakesleeanus TaxID=4837 RepID=A0ABR3AYJ2_PHYBL